MVGEVSFILAVVITHLRRLVDLFASEIARNQELVTLTSVEVSQTIKCSYFSLPFFPKTKKDITTTTSLFSITILYMVLPIEIQ